MLQYKPTINFAFWLTFFPFAFVYGSQNSVLNPCGKITLDSPQDHVTSPSVVVVNGNRTLLTYPNHTTCEWFLKNTPGGTITISFEHFDLEEGPEPCEQSPCCADTWLSIKIPVIALPKTSFLLESQARPLQDLRGPLCGRNITLPPIHINSPSVVIKFHSGRSTAGAKGFMLDYIINKQAKHICSPGLFQCNNGRCILNLWICNGKDECGDNSDETDCISSSMPMTRKCSNSTTRYHLMKQWCNGIIDCPNGEDEKDCNLKVESCNNVTLRCNGNRDCPDGSDEEGCSSKSCAPHKGGFLCDNRRCIASSMRCDGVHDCGDYSDEDGCMTMSVITAVILGSLLCGLLFVVAAGCGIRLYHLRLALERHWAAEREELHSNSTDVDAFGRRRPVMGRLPPPTYSQAMGFPNPYPLPAVPTRSSNVARDTHRSRRHSSRRSRRPAPPLPPPDAGPTAEVTPPIAAAAVPVAVPVAGTGLENASTCEDANLLRRIWQRWRKSVPTQQRDQNDATSIMLDSSSGTMSESPDESIVSIDILPENSPSRQAITFQASEVDTTPLIESSVE